MGFVFLDLAGSNAAVAVLGNGQLSGSSVHLRILSVTITGFVHNQIQIRVVRGMRHGLEVPDDIQ